MSSRSEEVRSIHNVLSRIVETSVTGKGFEMAGVLSAIPAKSWNSHPGTGSTSANQGNYE
jgi:hypothetical protein